MRSSIIHHSTITESRRTLETAVRAGRLLRVARGWYATPDADPGMVRALQLGGRLTCLSASRYLGIWTPSDSSLHIAVRSGDPLHRMSGVRPHRLESAGWGTTEPIMPLTTVLDHALRYHPVETGLMVVESAIDKRLATVDEVQRIIRAQESRKLMTGLQHFDPRAGSGSETRVRLWFQRRQVPVRCQVQIGWVGRVDLLVGTSLVVEVDSASHHGSPEQHDEDCRRDLLLASLGFSVIRITYKQIFSSWPATVSQLKAALAWGIHRRRPSGDAQVWLPELPWTTPDVHNC